jgi:8-amino-7-oxononanoate synthase
MVVSGRSGAGDGQRLLEERLVYQLSNREKEGTLRSLLPPSSKLKDSNNPPGATRDEDDDKIDFASNDYLGLARCPQQWERVKNSVSSHSNGEKCKLGATGSRLLSGDSRLARDLEERLARLHGQEAALLTNSGYDANLSLLSSVPVEQDVVLMDELIHNSVIMAVRMGRCRNVHSFSHNSVTHLCQLLQQHQTSLTNSAIFIVVESVYSMDGDIAPLKRILDVANEYGAVVMVDEAHGLGVYGRTNPHQLTLTTVSSPRQQSIFKEKHHQENKLTMGGTGVLAALNLESHPSLLCGVFTFGKAAGCHGAVICGSLTLITYLINYARPFIYSTSLPPHALHCISCAYDTLISPQEEERRHRVFDLVHYFRSRIRETLSKEENGSPICSSSGKIIYLIESPSPIQALVVPGNDACIATCRDLTRIGKVQLFPIRSPTVPKGQERIRIILHAHNTRAQVDSLVSLLYQSLVNQQSNHPYDSNSNNDTGRKGIIPPSRL